MALLIFPRLLNPPLALHKYHDRVGSLDSRSSSSSIPACSTQIARSSNLSAHPSIPPPSAAPRYLPRPHHGQHLHHHWLSPIPLLCTQFSLPSISYLDTCARLVCSLRRPCSQDNDPRPPAALNTSCACVCVCLSPQVDVLI